MIVGDGGDTITNWDDDKNEVTILFSQECNQRFSIIPEKKY